MTLISSLGFDNRATLLTFLGLDWYIGRFILKVIYSIDEERRMFFSSLKRHHVFLVMAIVLAMLSFSEVAGVQFVNLGRANPKTIVVPDDYSTIQLAINIASEGDTILVRSGTYNEHVVVNKTVSLLGSDGTVINAAGDSGSSLKPAIARWIGITVLANYSTIEGFTIINADNSGIEVKADYCTVQNNIIEGCKNRGGISLNAYVDSYAQEHDGLRYHSPNHNLIRNNTVKSSLTGVFLSDAHANSIKLNVLENNHLAGIYFLEYSSENIITDNIFSKSSPVSEGWGGYGIAVGTGSSNNLFVHNNVSYNSKIGISVELHGSGYPLPSMNLFYQNYMVGNTIQAYDSGISNVWDGGYPYGGNYWSDYGGVDLKTGPSQNLDCSDGIGDTAYVIEVNNLDHYPLMTQYRSPEVTHRLVNFSDSFKDSEGNSLYTEPSSFVLTFQNGTTSSPLKVGTYSIQTGITLLRSAVWQGTEVAPDIITMFDSTVGNPTIRCKIYRLTIDPVFYETNQTIQKKPDSWTISFPNSTSRTVSSAVTYSQIQAGTYSIFNVSLGDTRIFAGVPITYLTSNRMWSPRIQIMSHQGQVYVAGSNSTITELDFDESSGVLSFSASGANGTSGYVIIALAKSLVADSSSIVVQLDGGQVPCSVTSSNSTWLLYIRYKHSTHRFVINFKTGAIPKSTSPSPSPSPSPTQPPSQSPNPSPTPFPSEYPSPSPKPESGLSAGLSLTMEAVFAIVIIVTLVLIIAVVLRKQR